MISVFLLLVTTTAISLETRVGIPALAGAAIVLIIMVSHCALC